ELDVSRFDAALSMLNYLAVWTLNRDWRAARLPDGAHQSLVPSQRFPTRDGWIVVMCMKEKFWERLVDCLELGALRDDPRFRSFADRLEHRDALVPLLARTFGTRTTAEWLARLRGRVPAAPVHAVEEARDPRCLGSRSSSAGEGPMRCTDPSVTGQGRGLIWRTGPGRSLDALERIVPRGERVITRAAASKRDRSFGAAPELLVAVE